MIRPHAPRRRGFTLIELLVVLSIITVIAGLSVGVFMRVRRAQTESAAVLIVNKLQSQLDQQWKAAVDDARDDVKKGQLSTFAANNGGGDQRRELVIHTKLVLKREFPQTFAEAVVWPGTVGLQAKSSYLRAITAQVNANLIQANAATLSDDQKHAESAALLYMALTQGRRGQATGFNPIDALGPHAVGDVTVTWYGGAATFKCFIDTWGVPIAFVRWPTGIDGAHELSNAPYATQSTIAGATVLVDPQDPEKTLDQTLYPTWSGRALFIANVHFLSPNGPQNLIPVIMSAGPDKTFGVAADFGSAYPAADDNLYGYRSRGLGRK